MDVAEKLEQKHLRGSRAQLHLRGRGHLVDTIPDASLPGVLGGDFRQSKEESTQKSWMGFCRTAPHLIQTAKRVKRDNRWVKKHFTKYEFGHF